jgi:hypothetical protein
MRDDTSARGAMSVHRMTATPEADGSLHLTVPVGATSGTFDVSVVATPRAESSSAESGWPDGYFERTYGSVADDSFVAPPRLPPEPVEPLG